MSNSGTERLSEATETLLESLFDDDNGDDGGELMLLDENEFGQNASTEIKYKPNEPPFEHWLLRNLAIPFYKAILTQRSCSFSTNAYFHFDIFLNG